MQHFSQECRTRKQPEEPLITQVSPHKHSPMSDWNGDSQTLAFIAGQVANQCPHWESITQDPVILSAILHYNIEFEEKPPLQTLLPKNIIFSSSDREVINNEIVKLIHKRVMEKTNHTPDSYLSNVFVHPKKDGTHRIILNH